MTTTKLKIIALIAMFIDHVGQFITTAPEWFHWIGRVAAPIFIYAVVIGYQHTSNRRKYIIRLYLFSLGMAILNLIINISFNDTQMYITNNFFAPLFLIAMIILLLEKSQGKYVIYLIIWQILAFFLSVLFVEFLNINLTSDTTINYQFFGSIFGSILFIEGGPLFVLLGLFLYLSRNKKGNTAIIYCLFSLFCYVVYVKWGQRQDFLFPYIVQFAKYQWIMIAALPLILFYNGKKGIGLKHFFYIFYPTHIIILYFIGVYLR
ncbi:TraX family protein [Sporosarcina sp. G11-34]|uniref:TraX family protein n=1 Tax=Sporosarcina sp. G11-34 TaxID=2849605 RepID=UPI0022A95B50|nr:TraX family protein [Sporosarcina sp. G11-34]MCZ2260967.1 conjugal transfer protein TraX [Sporosarcina sp. G11-34]